MENDKHIEFWVQNSERDLKTAFGMFDAGFYDWSLFIGYLSLEKLLKAIWIKQNNQTIPPKVHNLLYLAENSKIQLDNEMKKKLILINQFQIETRYQDYKNEFYKLATKDFAETNLKII